MITSEDKSSIEFSMRHRLPLGTSSLMIYKGIPSVKCFLDLPATYPDELEVHAETGGKGVDCSIHSKIRDFIARSLF